MKILKENLSYRELKTWSQDKKVLSISIGLCPSKQICYSRIEYVNKNTKNEYNLN